MSSRRVPVWPFVFGGVLLLLVIMAIPLELIARSQLMNAVAKVNATVPSLRITPSSGLALWQVATGRIDLVVSVGQDQLEHIVNCRTDEDVALTITPSGILVETSRSIGGMSLPVGVLLIPKSTPTGWILTADSLTAGGISIPVTRAANLLGDQGGPLQRLVQGIPLPSNPTAQVTGVTVASHELRLNLSVAARVPAQSPGGEAIAALTECLAEERSPQDNTDDNTEETAP